jgi:FkbM family methyltransferase
MENIKELFEKYILDITGERLENLNIVVCGLELQICGGVLKYLDDSVPIKLVSFDLRTAGYIYDNHECKLPEEYMPYTSNTIVLVSLLYEYEYQNVVKKFESIGIEENQIYHVRSFSEELLKKTADYYAQNKMDLKVKELFDKIGRDISTINYVDIGANNYLLYNNTYLFYRAGAKGVLVEANHDFAEILRSNRPNDILCLAGCSDCDNQEGMTYYKTNRAGYNTFVEEIANGYGEKGIDIVETFKVPIYGINTILEKYVPEGHIDYMSIDIEGMGDRVLDALDFSKYSIDILLIEMEFNTDVSRQLYLKLKNLGYQAQYRGIGGGKDFLFYKKEVFE